MAGTHEFSETTTHHKNIIYPALAASNIVAGTGITAAMYAKRFLKVAGDGGAVSISATPSIAAGSDGQILIIQGTHDTNTVTLQDESGLTGSKLQLAGGANMVLGQYDTITLIYDGTSAFWCEISRSDN